MRLGPLDEFLYSEPDMAGNDLIDRAIDTIVDSINREDWETADMLFAMMEDGRIDEGSPWEPAYPSGDEEGNRIIRKLYDLRHKFEATPGIHEIIVRDIEDYDTPLNEEVPDA